MPPIGAVAAVLILALGQAGRSSAEALFDRAVKRAVESAQAEMVKKLTLGEDHSTWNDPWIVKSPHYIVRNTHSRMLGADVAQDLEAMLVHFRTLLQTDYEPDQPLVVNIYPTITDYNNYGNNFGDHTSIYGACYVGEDPQRPVVTYWVNNRSLLRMWITHAASHQFVAHAFPGHPLPLWIEEGLAAYFSLFWDYDFGVNQLQRLHKERRLVPLGTLLRSPIQAYKNNADERFIELAMLFTYLLQFREDTRTVLRDDGSELAAPFADFLRAVVRGQNPGDNAVQQLFTRELGDLEQEFFAFDFSH
jgi:hypothetical protein